MEKIPDVDGKSENREEGKENIKSAGGSTGAKNIGQTNAGGAPRVNLISSSYYKPLNFEQNDKRKGSNKVTFSADVDTNEISGTEQDSSDFNCGEESSDKPIKEGGRVRGRQRYNKVVQVKTPRETENDQCKTQ